MRNSQVDTLLRTETTARTVRLRTLVTLRWMAILGQAAAVLVAELALGMSLPIVGCTVAILVSVGLNLVTTIASPSTQRLSERDAMLALLFDLTQLAVLLYLTGGLTNPFALFLLAPVTIAASVLSLNTSIILGIFSIAAATVLCFFYLPLRLASGAVIDPHPVYLFGFWVGIAIGVVFQALYARRVAMEAFNMAAALNATQMALEREMRLSSIGALAAAAAHELGTPLATIKLVAGELLQELEDPHLKEDAQLISDQAARCRRILERLSTANEPDDAQIREAPITAVLWEAARPHLKRDAKVTFRLNGVALEDPSGGVTAPQPQIPRRPEIIQGLRNLIQNAVDFSASEVWIDIEPTAASVVVTISDDGPGFGADILAELGEPFATTRGRKTGGDRQGYQGMGLGVFIAKTLLERTGATLDFRNRQATLVRGVSGSADAYSVSGAAVSVSWPTELIASARQSGLRLQVDPSRAAETAV
ncbi:MAG: ActS/PrrB/RegB family redox-sensitive histidine kinase [Pseudomonadota bacterium]